MLLIMYFTKEYKYKIDYKYINYFIVNIHLLWIAIQNTHKLLRTILKW